MPRLRSDGWEVVTSDLSDGDYPCDLADVSGPTKLVERVSTDRGPIQALVLSHAHDIESGIIDTTAESFDRHIAVNARASLLLIAAFARQVADTGARSSPSHAITPLAIFRTAPRRELSTACHLGRTRARFAPHLRQRRESGSDRHRLDG